MFFDEFDALGRRREGSESGVHHESVSSLLLSLMDGSKTRDGVFIMAATNRLDISTQPSFVQAGLSTLSKLARSSASNMWSSCAEISIEWQLQP